MLKHLALILGGLILLALASFVQQTNAVETASETNDVSEVQTPPIVLTNLVARDYYKNISRRFSQMVMRYHVSQKPLNDEISAQAWTNLVTFYDSDHLIFLQSDLDALSPRLKTLDDEIKKGNVSFAYDVYNVFTRRICERVDFITNLIAKTEWDFSVDEKWQIKREDLPWPKTREEAEELLRLRTKNELLASILARELKEERQAKARAKKAASASADKEETVESDEEDDSTTPEQSLISKYRQYLYALTEPDEERVLQNYLSAITHAYDPHSDYMSPETKDDFDTEMNLSLCGVGAVLSVDDGALKIVEIVPGGPMDVDGRIKEGDHITGVKQDKGTMENIVWQPMRKSIKKIRGPKGTRVTLEIVPRQDPLGATHRLIELVRDEIKLEEQAATGRVIHVESPIDNIKIGYIKLPSFYASMDKRPGQDGFRSCSEDVAKYLSEFNAQDVKGLILDLRGNGGGSLREAVELSGMFVPDGPVVLVRDNRMIQPLMLQPGHPVAFTQPMVVLIDRASASASEIVAAHLRDVGRAVVIGDVRTHGKGTVQTVMGMGPEKYGSLKLTTARFYRINGCSTQIRGVESDIHLPSVLDSLDIGEDKLPHALPFSAVNPARYLPVWNLPDYVKTLKSLSDVRLETNELYKTHLAAVEAMKQIYERKEVPLERQARKAMMENDYKQNDLNLDEEEEDESTQGKTARERRNLRRIEAEKKDIVRQESERILVDLIRLSEGNPMTIRLSGWMNDLFGF